ncbi:ATP-binding protein [Tuanshanicoccus lijuaniae]|uniref:ATP-binding protein n=1 Tax=Aerococcaceae bacterium zg-1292 TaxID=2774330 RepID=UPI001BD8AD28|nr:ATP-binding protein [Aerococcaceae bacterium zg-A91]MBS4458524.1 ATP-binding protein [Aerococcaceae bacterium zg-BR33]
MKIVNRTKYLEKIAPFVNKPIIKVLTGMRRTGKSTLLDLIKMNLLDAAENNSLHLNFESLDLFSVKTAEALVDYLMPKLTANPNIRYLFFDEIQLVEDWEQVINALRLKEVYDIYITGSNSSLLSGDLATLLAGRYVQFEIQPFSFAEFCQLFESKNEDLETMFRSYIQFGGMPFLHYFDLEPAPSYKYLSDVYNTVVVKDVLEYNKIRDVEVFNRIIRYCIENIGRVFSANNIKNYLKNEKMNVSVDTVLSYLEYCQRAFIMKKVPRYNVQGKQIMKVDEKYYLTDHGFRQAVGFSNQAAIERVLENIVYQELVSRGYDVSIGKVGDKEIDFVAKKHNQIEYYQVSYLMSDEATRKREFGVYHEVQDNFPKFVLSMDKVDFSQDGIRHINMLDFLMGE